MAGLCYVWKGRKIFELFLAMYALIGYVDTRK